MSKLTAISPCEQISLPGISSAISKHLFAEFEAYREDRRASLPAIVNRAILDDINHAFSVAAEAHASAVLVVERSVRAEARIGYRSGTRTVRVGGLLGSWTSPLSKAAEVC